jgi:hypothetical protein
VLTTIRDNNVLDDGEAASTLDWFGAGMIVSVEVVEGVNESFRSLTTPTGIYISVDDLPSYTGETREGIFR